MADRQTSQGNARDLPIIPAASTPTVSLQVLGFEDVRRVSVLLSGYFWPALRSFHREVDTLAVQLIVPLDGRTTKKGGFPPWL